MHMQLHGTWIVSDGCMGMSGEVVQESLVVLDSVESWLALLGAEFVGHV